jgi:hypothetical protein
VYLHVECDEYCLSELARDSESTAKCTMSNPCKALHEVYSASSSSKSGDDIAPNTFTISGRGNGGGGGGHALVIILLIVALSAITLTSYALYKRFKDGGASWYRPDFSSRAYGGLLGDMRKNRTNPNVADNDFDGALNFSPFTGGAFTEGEDEITFSSGRNDFEIDDDTTPLAYDPPTVNNNELSFQDDGDDDEVEMIL